MIQVLRRNLLNVMMPLTREIGELHAPYSHKLVSGRDYFQVRQMLATGQVLVSRTEGEASNLLIPGFWSHAALVADSQYVYEAIGRGVVRTDIVTFLTSKDYVLLIEPTFANAAQREVAVKWAAKMEGRPYDYHFTSSNRAFYCAELVWAAYQEACGKNVPFTLRKTLGVDTVVPQDFDNAKDKWAPVWESIVYYEQKRGLRRAG